MELNEYEHERKNKFKNCVEKYEIFFENCFERLGIAISSYPILIMILCIVINGALMSGFILIKSENDVEVLYTPQNSQSFQDRSFLRHNYPDPTIKDFLPYQLSDFGKYAEVIILSKNRTNIKSKEYFEEFRIIARFIKEAVIISENGTLKDFKDLCAVQFGKCSVFGDVVLSLQFEHDFLLDKITYPNYNQSLLSSILANSKSKNGILVSTTGVKLRFYLQNMSSSVKWELDFLTQIETLKTNYTEISYSTSDSLGKELEKNTNGDIQFFSLTFTLMLTYASFACASSFIKCNNIGNRLMLGFAGILAPVLAIGSAIGFVSIIGVEFTSIVGVMPFLVVGIGIDDMFILMSGIAEAPSLTTASIEDRIIFMMKKSGVAITITSLTDLLAFTVGATSVFVSIRLFCIYTGVAVFFCYLNQLFFFCPAICLNEKRTEQKRHFLCCVKVKADKYNSRIYQCLFSGFIPNKRDDVESDLEKYPKWFIIYGFLQPFLGKVFILLLSMAYTSFSIFGAIHQEQGLLLYNLVSEDSYFHKHSHWDEHFFKSEPIIALCIKEDLNYSSPVTQNIITSVLEKAKQNQYIDSTFEINWLESYKNTTNYNSSSEEKFVKGLNLLFKKWPMFSNDIIFNKDFSRIVSAKFYLKTENIKSTNAQGSLMLHLRSLSSNAGISCFFYAPAFIFYEQYVQIWPSTLQTVGVALGVMVVVTLVFMPYPLMVFVVTTTLVSILLGIFGFMYYWGLTLSSITMIHLVMSVGFSVDFSVHICHAFLAVKTEKRDDALKKAFDLVGGPILNAAISSLLGISMLGFSKSYIFQSFGKVMFLVIVFGLFHAAFVLPLILWALFPCYSTEQSKPEHNSVSSQQYLQPNQTLEHYKSIESISSRLGLRHVSCYPNEKLSSEKNVNVPITYTVGDLEVYCYKECRVFYAQNNRACSWDFCDFA